MPSDLPIKVKWYETTELTGKTHVPYSRKFELNAPVALICDTGIMSILGDTCGSWTATWEDNYRKLGFNQDKLTTLEDTSKFMAPIWKTTNNKFLVNGNLNLERWVNTWITHLLTFAKQRNSLVPDGTLFIVTGPGIKDKVIGFNPEDLVIGYSPAEPTPEFSVTQIEPPVALSLIHGVKVAETPKVSRYKRAWVI
jgi:hypothetical protein